MQPSYRSFGQHPPQRSPHAASRRGIGPMIGGSHPQQSLTPAQMQAQQEAQRNAVDLAKRRSRKPTDKNMPDGVEDVIIGDGVHRYRELREVERRLDATMMRKRLDVQSIRDSNVKRYRTMRIWISNTVEDQPWQADGALDVDTFDFSTNMDSSYKVKIEGRLLDDDDDVDALNIDSDDESQDTDSIDKDNNDPKKSLLEQKHRFSHFFKSLNIDFEKTRTRDFGDQTVEWKKPVPSTKSSNPLNAADFDQLEFKRGGDENVNITINLVRDEAPERFTLSPVLAEIMDASEATRAEVVTGIWQYIKVNGLQEDDEKRSFRCDSLLRQIFARATGYIPYIPDAILPHMTSLPPLKLAYTIRCDQAFHNDPQPTIYDVHVTLSDPLSAQLSSFNQNPSLPATLREIVGLNDQLSLFIQRIGESKAKHTFLTQLGKEPDLFMQRWMSSQKRDLEVIMGEATRGGGEDATSEEFRRGGKEGVWGSSHVKESVNLILAQRSRPVS